MKYVIAVTLSLLMAASASTHARSYSHVSQGFRSGISGRITDRNGSVVLGAKITIIARSSNAGVSRTSNDAGQYSADLDPDVYDVLVDANGFKKATRKSIPVEREGRNYVDFVLEVAEPIMPKLIH